MVATHGAIEHGYFKKLVSINKDDDSVCAVAIMCLNNNLRFFVRNTVTATSKEPHYRVRWRQVVEQSDKLEPELMETVINMTVMIEAYYSASGAIDTNNKKIQDDLYIERKIRTKY